MGCGMSVPRERLHYSTHPGDTWDAQYAAHRRGVRSATTDPVYEAKWRSARREDEGIVRSERGVEREKREDGPFLSEGWGVR